jgi:lactoylglutathione lyase
MQIEHVAIWTRDLERIRDFYETYFGARSNDRYRRGEREFSSYFLSFDSGARLEIMRVPSVPNSENDPYRQLTGLIHIAFSVGSIEEVNSLTARLATDGFEVLDGPRTTGDGYYESVVLDPDKNRVEITV